MSMCNEETSNLVMPTGEYEARRRVKELEKKLLEVAGDSIRYKNALELIAEWRGGCGVGWPQEIARNALNLNTGHQGTPHLVRRTLDGLVQLSESDLKK